MDERIGKTIENPELLDDDDLDDIEELFDDLDPELEALMDSQDEEDEIEQRRRLPEPPLIDYIPRGFDPEAHQRQAREWHAITAKYAADPFIFSGD